MYATALPSEDAAPTRIPQALRAHSRLRFEACLAGARTVPGQVSEAGHARVRFPLSGRRSGALEAVLLNTGGGIAGGDTIANEIHARTGTRLTVTSQAAEKVYRSDGAVSALDVALWVEAGARLDWLPQPTILFDAAHVERRIAADIAADARLLMIEQVILGRTARGERFQTGRLSDSWRIRRDGRLIYADGFHLGADAAATLARPAVTGGWPAFATLLLVAPGAEDLLAPARITLGLPDGAAQDDAPLAAEPEAGGDLEAGVSAWDGMLSVRLIGRHGGAVEAAVRRLIGRLGLAETPRIWHS
ncbi:urease accessory protein UreD [Ancylobacter sp. 6x-1]|uniref:Urease accessory protein UreD n=1 Tax=Ancylobacter crimeensis TaxID=2579147 RepID=A0ABT0D6F2_9HYPH|nr:urease accessory protein UreD [Ancylobacter crimeensis]MCK0195530.1 urease accessory protein UreD [Ancylobacter crimeensis]